MKNITFILLIILSCYGCKKDNNEIYKFSTGTYSGEKTIYYSDTHYKSFDTISIKFDNNTYSYSGSDALDFGRGNYLIKNNSIEFNDEEARIALYTWEWILGGTHNFRVIADSLIMNQNGSYVQVTCKLKKIAK